MELLSDIGFRFLLRPKIRTRFETGKSPNAKFWRSGSVSDKNPDRQDTRNFSLARMS
jgi:hypothetical protein